MFYEVEFYILVGIYIKYNIIFCLLKPFLINFSLNVLRPNKLITIILQDTLYKIYCANRKKPC